MKVSNDMSIENVMITESLLLNLLSSIQLAMHGFDSYLEIPHVTFYWSNKLKASFIAYLKNKLYLADLSKKGTKL
jgi:hypothetical protein